MAGGDITVPNPLPQQHFRVEHISKNWVSSDEEPDKQMSSKKPVALQLEEYINAYYMRRPPYLLHSFEYNCISTGPKAYRESIIAVFERKGSQH